ncbi:MAG: YhbY family RNA-binding protein [Pseudomonadota bacterium]
MTLTSREKKQFRQIAHHLDAVVTLADAAISEGVKDETDRALTDHELIKVKIALLEKEVRNAAADNLAAACSAEVVQRIGKMVVLYRNNPKANPKLSNILRYT